MDVTQEFILDTIRTELRTFKEDFVKTVRNEFQLLKDDLAELRSSLKATNDRMCNLEERMTVVENQKLTQATVTPDVNNIIDQLRSDINDRDQELLSNDVQISNLPEIASENPVHTVLMLSNKIGIKIEARDIVSAERVGGRRADVTQATGPVETRPRYLVIRLARRDLRDDLLEAARARRGMTSADLDIPGPTRRFYVNERLTKSNRELFRKAREAGARFGWQFVWSKRGRILSRNKPGDPIYQIRCEADIQRIFAAAPSNETSK